MPLNGVWDFYRLVFGAGIPKAVSCHQEAAVRFTLHPLRSTLLQGGCRTVELVGTWRFLYILIPALIGSHGSELALLLSVGTFLVSVRRNGMEPSAVSPHPHVMSIYT